MSKDILIVESYSDLQSIEKNKKIMNYLETFDKDNPPHKRFESLVGDFIANAK
jgi:hypothetical protein